MISKTLLPTIPTEIGKIAKILAAKANKVGFFKHAPKCEIPRNWRLSQ